MDNYKQAIDLICRYEGFNELAYPDPQTGVEPYTIGFGTQYYPDGSVVKKGQCCTKHKALEYLVDELTVLNTELLRLNLGLDECMHQALLSFCHSVGWESFLYSSIIDCLEVDDYVGVTEEIARWVFDAEHQVIGVLLERRREEINLFLTDVETKPWVTTDVLLRAFKSYGAKPHETEAIRTLETTINPYSLAEFANRFKLDDTSAFSSD
jgi:lysozyme